MKLNGISSDVRAFFTKKSFEKVSEYYRDEWQAEVDMGKEGKLSPGYTETDAMRPWRLFTRIEDGYLMTAQFQPADRMKGTWGYLAISKLPAKDKQASASIDIGKDIPALGNSHVISELNTDDPGKQARTMIIYNTHSVGSNVSYYRSYYTGRGYSVDMDTEISPGKMHTLVFKSARKRINIVLIGSNNDTRVVINAVTNSIL